MPDIASASNPASHCRSPTRPPMDVRHKWPRLRDSAPVSTHDVAARLADPTSGQKKGGSREASRTAHEAPSDLTERCHMRKQTYYGRCLFWGVKKRRSAPWAVGYVRAPSRSSERAPGSRHPRHLHPPPTCTQHPPAWVGDWVLGAALVRLAPAAWACAHASVLHTPSSAARS